MKKILAVLFIIILAACACKSDKFPSDVLTPQALKEVMCDLLAVGELRISDTTSAVRLNLKDSTTADFNYILQMHNVARKDLLYSLKYYEAHPDKENELVDTLMAYNGRQLKIYEKKDSLNRSKRSDTLKAIHPNKNSQKDTTLLRIKKINTKLNLIK